MVNIKTDGDRKRALVVGRYGDAGSHTHLCEVTFSVQDEGQPWERMKIYSARPCCTGIRRGDKQAHGLQFNADVNTKSITCEKCREFGVVSKE